MKSHPFDGMAISESLYGFEESFITGSSINHPTDLHNKLPAASMGNCHRDAKNLAILLQNMQSGISAYQKVLSSLEQSYGAEFRQEYYRVKREGEV